MKMPEQEKPVCPLLGRACHGENNCAPAMIACKGGELGDPICPIVALVGSISCLAVGFNDDIEDAPVPDSPVLEILTREQAIAGLGNPDIVKDEKIQKE